jgi:hypothetical protein
MLLGLTLTACTPEPQSHNVQERNPQAVGAIPRERTVQGTSVEPVKRAEEMPITSDGDLLVGILEGENLDLPFPLNRGVFSVRNGCLLVTVSGKAYTPILYSWPKRTPTGFRINERSFDLGREYMLGGGPVTRSHPNIVVPDAVRQRCETSYYAVADISLD